MKNKILVLGYFGYVTNQLDGQTVKTRNIYELLKSKEEQIGEVRFFDTQQFQQSKLTFFKMFWLLTKAKKVVYLPAHDNLKYIFPFIFVISKIFRIEILYIVVGGWLYEYLQSKPLHRNFLKRIRGIFPENQQLCEKLKANYGFQNVTQLTNFRIHDFKPVINYPKDSFRIVFMARVTILKGIDIVFRLAQFIEKKYSTGKKITIDIYGPVAENEKDYFFSELKNNANTKYLGVINQKDVYSVLSQYDILVLPTRYPGEGFPGTILDAYISGIPVIASNWKYIPEVVDVGKTGYLFELKNEKEFFQSVDKLYNDKELLYRMKSNAYEKSKLYSSDYAWLILKKYLLP